MQLCVIQTLTQLGISNKNILRIKWIFALHDTYKKGHKEKTIELNYYFTFFAFVPLFCPFLSFCSSLFRFFPMFYVQFLLFNRKLKLIQRKTKSTICTKHSKCKYELRAAKTIWHFFFICFSRFHCIITLGYGYFSSRITKNECFMWHNPKCENKSGTNEFKTINIEKKKTSKDNGEMGKGRWIWKMRKQTFQFDPLRRYNFFFIYFIVDANVICDIYIIYFFVMHALVCLSVAIVLSFFFFCCTYDNNSGLLFSVCIRYKG